MREAVASLIGVGLGFRVGSVSAVGVWPQDVIEVGRQLGIVSRALALRVVAF